MERDEDKLLDHDYDGIQELDNNLPPWWLNMFYISIVFAIAYVLYFHVFHIGFLQEDQYKKELDPAYKRPVSPAQVIPGYTGPYYTGKVEETPMSLANSATSTNGAPAPDATAPAKTEPAKKLTALTDDAALAAGKAIFMTNCIPCHGAHAEGGIGPNLTDTYWIHGNGQINDVFHTITEGVIAKGMIPWKTSLNEEQRLQVASYVLSLQGTNPANAKAPEGTDVSGK